MLELAPIIISSLAGVATAAAVRRIPRGGARLRTLGASAHVRGRIAALETERDILTKTISRLYQDGSGLSRVQRDRLLARYQHQLGVILAKIERMEQASRHPDLGPVGDGLITLMDQKLSRLDERLHEISSKISAADAPAQAAGRQSRRAGQAAAAPPAARADAPAAAPAAAPPAARADSPAAAVQEAAPPAAAPPAATAAAQAPRPGRAFELTTLTDFGASPRFPLPGDPGPAPAPRPAPAAAPRPRPAAAREEIARPPSPGSAGAAAAQPVPDVRAELARATGVKALPGPAGDELDEDGDDLARIKGDIMRVLSKLDQAEVE